MSRLTPHRSAFRILKTAEGLDELPAILAFGAGMFVLFHSGELWLLGTAIVAARLIGLAYVSVGLFIVPGIVALSTLVSYLSGYGLLLIAALVTATLKHGWKVAVAFAVLWTVGAAAEMAADFLCTYARNKLSGRIVTFSEVCFRNAFRLHAAAVEKSTDLELTATERIAWMFCLKEYADNYPRAVERFADDYEQALADLEPKARSRGIGGR